MADKAKKKLGRYKCQTCKQDMRAQPHEGMAGNDCPQCGQGINWHRVVYLNRKRKMQKTRAARKD